MTVVETTALVQATLMAEAIDETLNAVIVSEEDLGRIVAANNAAAKLLGYTREELLTLRAGEWAAQAPEELRASSRRLAEDGELRSTARLRKHDGQLLEIDYWSSATRVGSIPFVLTITAPIFTARLLS